MFDNEEINFYIYHLNIIDALSIYIHDILLIIMVNHMMQKVQRIAHQITYLRYFIKSTNNK